MRLGSCSCRLSLDVRIAAFAATMVWVICLAVSKVVSSFSALLMRGLQTSLLAWSFGVAELTVFGRASLQNISLKGVQAIAGNRCHLLLLQKVPGETLPVLPSLASRSNSMIQCLVCCALWILPFLLNCALESRIGTLSVGRHDVLNTHTCKPASFFDTVRTPSHLLWLRSSCLFPWLYLKV